MLDKTKSSYDWIRYLPPSILQWDEIPLLGLPPPFPWEGLTQNLSQLFNIKDLKIEPIDTQWKAQEDLLQGFVDPQPIFFSITTIEGHVTWIMNRADIETILTSLIIKNGQRPPFTDPGLLEGFYQFVAVETLHSLSQLEWDKTLAIHTFINGELPTDAALCVDVSLSLPPQNFNGRLLISNAFRKSWAQHYTPKTPDAYLHTPLAEQLTLPLSIEAGKTDLTQEEWKSISTGDFILLDQCSIDSDSYQGQVLVAINNTPVFNAELADGNIKIIEFTQKHEEARTMETPSNRDNHDEDEYDEFEIDEELDFDEEEFNLDDEEEDEEFSDEEFDEDFEAETSLNLDEELHKRETSAKHKTKASPETTAAPKTIKETTQPTAELFSPSEIPLSISVEIGRVQLSIQKLMELAPGNMLELGIKPENGVNLIFNGKCIARGELLRIGDTLGVRILEKR